MTDWVEAFERTFAVFNQLGIRYMIGGSLASSATGIWRATQDIDIIAELTRDTTERLAKVLEHYYYADAETMRDAVEQGRPLLSFTTVRASSPTYFQSLRILTI